MCLMVSEIDLSSSMKISAFVYMMMITKKEITLKSLCNASMQLYRLSSLHVFLSHYPCDFITLPLLV